MCESDLRIRPIQAQRDAEGAAVLIRQCFASWVEWDNDAYLSRLEKEGRRFREHSLLSRFCSFPYAMEGVVCVDELERVRGLASAFPFLLNGRYCCLLANVCVDPAYRRRGIAGRMVEAVAEDRRRQGDYGLYLQARRERPEAITLYREHGFSVTDLRNDWIFPLPRAKMPHGAGFSLRRVENREKGSFETEFRERYPTSILWNLEYNEGLFRPGLSGELLNLLAGMGSCFRALEDRKGVSLCRAAYQPQRGFADELWVVPHANLTSEALRFLALSLQRNKPLRLNAPASDSPELYREAGFIMQHALAWMWKKL